MSQIVLHEVGLRDGLQMEKQVVPTAQKIADVFGMLLPTPKMVKRIHEQAPVIQLVFTFINDHP